MKFMKKVKKLGLCLSLCLLTLPLNTINAAEIYDESSASSAEQTASGMFSHLTDSDKVLKLSDGSYLHGEAEVYDMDHELLTTYDSNTDPEAITVAKAKEECIEQIEADLANEENQKDSRYANWPPRKDMYLSYGASYSRIITEGSSPGWRFSEFSFFPKAGTGDYLRWRTYGDSARVGSRGDANATYEGTLRGTPIYEGKYYWLSFNPGQAYYSYQPKSGSYYQVANVDI